MLTKRIIPCLDIKDGRVVKGVTFINLVDAGDAVELAARYELEGADELAFLDITASYEKRKTIVELVKSVARAIRIPFTVGGGISEINDIDNLLKAGADKVTLNTIISQRPEIITEAAKRFGSQAIVAAIDVKHLDGRYKAFIKGGKEETEFEGLELCKRAVEYGAGEILLTSMNKDGTKSGYDISFLSQLKKSVAVPIIASGGAGEMKHFLEAFKNANADACLAASLFHFGIINIRDLKMFLHNNEINIRL